MTSNCAVVFA